MNKGVKMDKYAKYWVDEDLDDEALSAMAKVHEPLNSGMIDRQFKASLKRGIDDETFAKFAKLPL